MNDATPSTTPDNTIPSQDEDLEASLVQLASRLFPKDEVQKNMRYMEDMEARVSELEARLAMAEEAKSLALKEREVADEGRKKLEKTLAELLSKFAGVRENHAALLRDAEQARAGYDAHKVQMHEAERVATAARESEAILRAESETLRAETAKLRDDNEDLRNRLESQFLNLEVLQTQLRSEQAERENMREEIKKIKAYANGEIKPALAENDRFSREMVTHVEDIVEQLRALREDVAQRCNQMENVANYLGGQITETHEKLTRRLNPQQPAEKEEVEEVPPAMALDSKPNLQAQHA